MRTKERKLQKNKSRSSDPTNSLPPPNLQDLNATADDLAVEIISDSLRGRTVDLIVSGSIGAIESPRFIRSLRRLHCTVIPWLTSGGKQFVTPLSLSWAAAQPCRETFESSASHIAIHDACVIAPCSANFLTKIASGQTDTPASALVSSYLGQKKPVILVLNMHSSLFNAQPFQTQLQKLKPHVKILDARLDEGKLKFPQPEIFADQVSHLIQKKDRDVLVSLGSMKGYLDDVRYLSNYSSGSLGSLICEELYRHGVNVRALVGSCEIKPRVFNQRDDFETFEDLARLYKKNSTSASKLHGAALLASVLDYIPKKKLEGKTKSGIKNLSVELKTTEKLIANFTIKGPKVGFKLESSVDEKSATKIGRDYIAKYNLSLCVVNSVQQVSRSNHTAYLVSKDSAKKVEGKLQVARAIAQHILDRI